MSFLYPLTTVVDKIVEDISKSLQKSSHERWQLDDLIRYAKFVGDELSVNSVLNEFKEAQGFKRPTIELVFKKTYMTIDEIVFVKHWTCYPELDYEPYFKITREITAQLRRSQIRPVDNVTGNPC